MFTCLDAQISWPIVWNDNAYLALPMGDSESETTLLFAQTVVVTLSAMLQVLYTVKRPIFWKPYDLKLTLSILKTALPFFV